MITLAVKQLTKRYNTQLVLSKLSFDHTQGVLGIAGANGSGKSTLMKCLAYLARQNSGQIEWSSNNQPLSKQEVQSGLAYVAPYINLYEELTVVENLEFIRDLNHAKRTHNSIDQLLERVGMTDFGHRYYKSLSTGQQQRIKLASSLVRTPRILLLDEPGSNLDEKGQLLVKSLVDEQRQADTLVIIATNSNRELELCDQIISVEHASLSSS